MHHRLPSLLVAAMPVCRRILKIDSTKVCRKLQGSAAGTASWATNVGNERGKVVASVLTDFEDVASLKELAEGLVRRYYNAGEPGTAVPRMVLQRSRPSLKDGQTFTLGWMSGISCAGWLKVSPLSRILCTGLSWQ